MTQADTRLLKVECMSTYAVAVGTAAPTVCSTSCVPLRVVGRAMGVGSALAVSTSLPPGTGVIDAFTHLPPT
jgi:hypothetical protein